MRRTMKQNAPKVNRAFSAGAFLCHDSWGAAPGSR
jgi:hypothetical protein